MFITKDKLAKIALGSMMTSVMTFATLMPVSAHELQPNADRNASMSMQRGVQEGLLPLSNLGILDKAAAQIIPLMGGQVAISDGDEQVANSETATTTTDHGQVINCGTTTPVDEEEAVENETAAPVEEEEAVENEAAAPTDEGQTVNRMYAKLLTSYDKLLSIYDHLLSIFGTAFTH
ncbi:hypothetical protein [Desulfosporosinus sp. BICA1-9]|uniref:hypothetical protein n=1 Tax=Desulfosporosinus sp. BICA1-9 TaxID=1531958 RepID=UPI00054B9BE1|nr:hypothetical protein [Desulfosporosinus sp. BICA1-9]KJS50137.1 MAG: hypothetical protein VR66_04655 [Peptococcaceae bacterium BRH_c23]KJS84499.1 MAG: hypothetical protein JL57_20385 [Desulfosporosinus sp. BICA1-9]HBW35020.1 hypothetical protein [Desulfosporosinus sp.]